MYFCQRHILDVISWPNLNTSNSDLESYNISCKLGNNKKLNISVVYRPPSGKLQSAINVISDNLSEIQRNSSGEIILLGDLNVDLLSGNNQAAKLKLLSGRHSLTQLIDSPTRFSASSATLIDHIYTDASHISHSGTLDLHISDHLPVFLIKKKVRNAIKYRESVCRSYKNFDEAKFITDIQRMDFFDVMITNDPDVCWVRLFKHITSVIDKHCPLVIHRIPIKKPEYITGEIVQLMHERDWAYKRAKKTGDKNTWQLARSLRSKVAAKLKLSKRLYILSQIEQVRGDSRKFWGIINKEFFSNSGAKVTQVYTQDKSKVLEGILAANELNRFFCTVLYCIISG